MTPTDVIESVHNARLIGGVPDLSHADLSGIDLQGVDLRGADSRRDTA